MIIQDMKSLNEFVKLVEANPQALTEIRLQTSHFWLSDNPEALQVFCSTLSKCKSLQSLDLTECNFFEDIFDNRLALLFASISRCTSLEKLNLSHCCLGKLYSLSKCQIVCEGIAKCIKLKTLDINNNNLISFNVNFLRALGNALSQLRLESINLSHNNLFDKGYGNNYTTNFPIFCEIISQCKTLQNINFANNISFRSVVSESFSTLGDALGLLPQLISIDFSGNELGKLGQRDFPKLSLLLLPCTHLQSIILNFNNLNLLIDYNGFRTLGHILKRCKMLRELHVLGNKLIFIEGISQILIDALSKCELLTTVYGIEEDLDPDRKLTTAFQQKLEVHRTAFNQMLEIHYSNGIGNALQKALPQSFPLVIQDLIIESLLSPLLYQQSIHNRNITRVSTNTPNNTNITQNNTQGHLENDPAEANTAVVIHPTCF